ncbi:MAG: ribosome silencing factor [Bacteroidales bacterium]|nr:ribosome silencing factor [Bacteroidales bacterium]
MGDSNREALLLLNSVLEGIYEKKGENIVKLDMRSLENSVCDYFIICHAQSGNQVDSIAESVGVTVKKITGERPMHKEGLDNCFWVLLDYGNVIVHIFIEEYRNFYNLEGLWADAVLEVMKENN